MNIRFIILKAGSSYTKEKNHFENYEIGFGCEKDPVTTMWKSREYASYEDAFAKLEEVQKMFPDIRYRLAAVWD